MIVVSDTGPLHYLIMIAEAEILPRLFGQVILPGAVHDELAQPETPEAIRNWLQNPPNWLEWQEIDAGGAFPSLDEGEREAIALALSLGADLVLMDEKKGRTVAQGQGLRVIGTLGVLAQAAEQNLLWLPDAINELRRTTFQVSEALIETVLEYDRLRRIRQQTAVTKPHQEQREE